MNIVKTNSNKVHAEKTTRKRYSILFPDVITSISHCGFQTERILRGKRKNIFKGSVSEITCKHCERILKKNK